MKLTVEQSRALKHALKHDREGFDVIIVREKEKRIVRKVQSKRKVKEYESTARS